jgi:hypothetical protein
VAQAVEEEKTKVVSADGSTQLGGTLASNRTFDYASRAKATWKRDFRLKYKSQYDLSTNASEEYGHRNGTITHES